MDFRLTATCSAARSLGKRAFCVARSAILFRLIEQHISGSPRLQLSPFRGLALREVSQPWRLECWRWGERPVCDFPRCLEWLLWVPLHLEMLTAGSDFVSRALERNSLNTF